MNVDYIESIFSSYLALSKTQYALMLNGAWGSGKTFFWKKNLAKKAEHNGFKTAYVSLNGISQIKTLEQHLFLSLVPILGHKNLKFLAKSLGVANEVAEKTSKAFLGVDISGIFSLITLDAAKLKNTAICFDDLERCQIPLKELLGFINDFVEHKYVKVIILADESNVNQKNESYDNIKEKVIGRVLNYQPNLEDIFPKLVEGFADNKEFHSFLKKHSDFMINLFISGKEDNLRIVSFTLNCIREVHPYLAKVKDIYIEECIFLLATISIEFKRGKLKSSEYLDSKGLEIANENQYSMWFSSRLRQKENGQEASKSYAELFYEKYVLGKGFSYHFYFSLYSFVLSGYFDDDKFLEEVREREPEKLTHEIKSFRILLNYKFRELENNEFEKLTKEVLMFAEKGSYGIYDYQQIGNFYNFFSTEKLFDENWKDVNKKLLKGLNIAAERKEIIEHLYESLIHFKNGNSEVEEIRKCVIDLHKEIKRDKDIFLSKNLVSLIKSGTNQEMARFLDDHKVSKEIIQYSDGNLLFEALITSDNKMVFDFTEMLKNRYEVSNIGEFLSGDYTTIKDLHSYVKDYLKSNKKIRGLRRFNFRSMENLLSEILNKLNHDKNLTQA